MLNGILLVLGHTPGAAKAQGLAFDLARKAKTTITGLVVVDPDIVAPPEPTPIGGSGYKQRKDEAALSRARTEAIEFERRFVNECQAAGVHCDATIAQGSTLKAVIDACSLHDVVVAGADSSVDGGGAAISPLVEKLLRDNPRPVIVSPAKASQGTATLVAYDGSVAAMRALQLFCLLGLGRDIQTVVVTVRDSQAEAADICVKATEYLHKRGYASVARPIASTSAPHTVVIQEARTVDAGMIVAGAYGHQGWREWLLGTTTQELLKNSPAPMFIHH